MSNSINTKETLIHVLEAIGVPLAMLGHSYITINPKAEVKIWGEYEKPELNEDETDWTTYSNNDYAIYLGKLEHADPDLVKECWKEMKLRVKQVD